MTFVLGGIGVIFCIGLALTGYFWPVLIGGLIGSFFGIAGFGGAVAGTIPGAFIGVVAAIALEQSVTSKQHAVSKRG